MKTLEIVFTTSKKHLPIGSWLIKLWTGRSYSHVARKFTVKDWAPMYYQASEGRVNYETEEVFLKKHKIIKSYKINIPPCIHDKISKACFEEAGKKYGTMQNIGIAVIDIIGKLKINIDNPFKKGQNCSELIYKHVLIPILGDLGHNPDTIKPHEIEEILKKHTNILTK